MAESDPNSLLESDAFLFFGDSHSDALRRAVERRRLEGRAAPFSVLRRRKEKNGVTVGDVSFDSFVERAAQLTSNDVVFQ